MNGPVAEKQPRSLLGKLLILRVLLFSVILTTFFTGVQAAIDYRTLIMGIHENMDDIKRIQVKGIIVALWHFDRKALEAQIEGVLQRQHITYVAVIEDKSVVIAAGERKLQNTIDREIPLVYAHLGKNIPLGALYIQADTTALLADMISRTARTFLFSLASVTITAFFLLSIFNRLVTRHLSSLASYFSRPDADYYHMSAPLSLNKKYRADEIDVLIDSFNHLRNNLISSYGELRQSEEQFRALVEQSITGIAVIKSGLFVYVNPRLAEIFGYQPEELIGISPADLVAEADREIVRESIRRRMSGELESDHFACRIMRKDGKERLVEAYSRSITYKGERAFLSTLLDISERKQAEEQRDQLEMQLRQAQKMEAVGQLAGGVAHDFNNILSAIMGYSSLTLMKMSADDPNRFNIDQVVTASERASSLTQSLLAFSRKQVVNLVKIDLDELVMQFEKFLLRLLREDIELKTIPAGEELPVIADRSQIEQALMNLVTNAQDAMPVGGRIVMEMRRVTLDQSFAQSRDMDLAGEYARLSVTDTGVGIPDTAKDKIFEPFFTTKEVGKGSGLGLAMVYGIVKQHSGCIDVHSDAGTGTTFRIYLPIDRTTAVTEERKTDNAPLVGGDETILLAEDDATVLRLTATLLRQSGYRVIESVDGLDAVAKFEENRDNIQLVLLDGIMPRMNGKEVWQAITALNPAIKAVFVSGYAEDIFTKDGIPDRKAAFMQKPVSLTTLLRTIRHVLDS